MVKVVILQYIYRNPAEGLLYSITVLCCPNENLVGAIRLQVSGTRIRCKGLLELTLLNGVESGTRDVDDERVQTAGKGAKSLREKAIDGVEVRLEDVGSLLGEDLVLEAGKLIGIQQSVGVVDATSQIANVHTGEGVDGASVATDVEELRVLDSHTNNILEEEGDAETTNQKC